MKAYPTRYYSLFRAGFLVLMVLLSGCNTTVELPSEHSCLIEGPFDKRDPLYEQVARATGGITYNMSHTEKPYLHPFPLGRTQRDPYTGVETGETTLLSFKTTDKRSTFVKAFPRLNYPLPDPHIATFPIDSTIEKIWLKIDAVAPTAVTLQSAEGEIVTIEQAEDITPTTPVISDYAQSCIIIVDKPAVGNWTLMLQGTKPILATVKARSSIRFVDFAFMKETLDRYGDNFFIKNPTPKIETPSFGRATLLGHPTYQTPLLFYTKDIRDTLLQELKSPPSADNRHLIEGIIPSFDEHYLYVEGKDNNGYPFLRRSPASIQIFKYLNPREETPYENPYTEEHYPVAY